MDRSRQQLSSSSSSSSISITNDICNDIIVEILSWLPVDSLFRFKSVCKSWFSLITNPIFVKLHINHHHYSLTATPQIHNHTIMFMSKTNYSLKSMDKLVSTPSSSSSTVIEKLEMVYPFDSTKYVLQIVGSCNGLICMSAYDHVNRKEILCIWNPSTKEFKQLPSHQEDDAPFKFPPDDDDDDDSDDDDGNGRSVSQIATFGFGYDHVLEDYKVIASVQRHDDDEMDDHDTYHNELKVYTLGTDSWRRIQGTPYENECYNITTSWLHVSGIFHRIAQLSSSQNRILSFDIVEEVYGEVPKPDCYHTKYEGTLAVLRGCLCLCSKEPLSMEICMMMKYGVKESWTKLFIIANGVDSHRMKPMWFGWNGELLMEDEIHSKLLVIYDPKHNGTKLLKSPFRADLPVQSVIYIASLVSLKSQKEVEKELIIC